MGYSSLNRLYDFEFHDAKLDLVSYADGSLTVSAMHLNIHSDAPQNPHDADMEIALARLTFTNFKAHSMQLDDPNRALSDEQALHKLLEEMHNVTIIMDFAANPDGTYELTTTGTEPWVQLICSFDSAMVEWDEYLQKAWYTRD